MADRDFAKAEQVRDAYGYEEAVTNYQELLRDPEIDVIDILTPPCLHKTMLLEALAAGKHVICEKPLTAFFGDPKTTTAREMYA